MMLLLIADLIAMLLGSTQLKDCLMFVFDIVCISID